MGIVSYSQNFEDVILWRIFENHGPGFYIDVGAWDPKLDSVTKAFYDRNWRGINIEPVSDWYNKLVLMRERDINLQIAVGDQRARKYLYELPETGLSTFDEDFARQHELDRDIKAIKKEVEIRTLSDICEEYQVEEIHFLKVDVEGAEKDVLRGMNFAKLRPWVVLVEATLPNTQTPSHEEWEPILLSQNYDFVYFDGLNRFYVDKAHADLKKHFQSPPNVHDHFLHIREIELGDKVNEAQRIDKIKELEIAEIKEKLQKFDLALDRIAQPIFKDVENPEGNLGQLIEEERAFLLALFQRMRSRKRHDQIKAVLLYDRGLSFADIAQILWRDTKVVQAYVIRYFLMHRRYYLRIMELKTWIKSKPLGKKIWGFLVKAI